MAYEVIMGLSASYAIVFVGTFTEYPSLCILLIFVSYNLWITLIICSPIPMV